MTYLALFTAPVDEPISLTEAKDHLRVTTTDEDALISEQIVTARRTAEAQTWRQLLTATWDYNLPGFANARRIFLPRSPLQSVTSVSYIDTDGNTQTVATADYTVHVPGGDRPARGWVALNFDKVWPSTQQQTDNAVTIRFVAGYGANPADVPEGIRHWMLIQIAKMYDMREGFNMATWTPSGFADALLDPYRLEAQG